MTWAVTVVVIGFSLPEGGRRRLDHDKPPPPPSHPSPPSPPPMSPPDVECTYSMGGRDCRDTPDHDCRQQDDDGLWTRDCHTHPTTNCKDLSGCVYPPPPPLLPAPPGGYSPPPAPPPDESEAQRNTVIAVSLLVLVLLVACICICVLRRYDYTRAGTDDRGRLNYCCCCILECCRPSNWNQDGKPRFGRTRPQALSDAKADERDQRLVSAIKDPDRAEQRVVGSVRFHLPALKLAFEPNPNNGNNPNNPNNPNPNPTSR